MAVYSTRFAAGFVHPGETLNAYVGLPGETAVIKFLFVSGEPGTDLVAVDGVFHEPAGLVDSGTHRLLADPDREWAYALETRIVIEEDDRLQIENRNSDDISYSLHGYRLGT